MLIQKPGPEAYALTTPKFSKAACAMGPVDEIRSRFSSPLHLAGIFGWGLEPNLQKRQGANNILPGGDACLIRPGFVFVRERSAVSNAVEVKPTFPPSWRQKSDSFQEFGDS